MTRLVRAPVRRPHRRLPLRAPPGTSLTRPIRTTKPSRKWWRTRSRMDPRANSPHRTPMRRSETYPRTVTSLSPPKLRLTNPPGKTFQWLQHRWRIRITNLSRCARMGGSRTGAEEDDSRFDVVPTPFRSVVHTRFLSGSACDGGITRFVSEWDDGGF